MASLPWWSPLALAWLGLSPQRDAGKAEDVDRVPGAFHPANGHAALGLQPADEASHAVVAAAKAVPANQILVDALPGQALLRPGEDQQPVPLTIAGPADTWLFCRLGASWRADGRNAGFDSALTASEPTGAMAGFDSGGPCCRY